MDSTIVAWLVSGVCVLLNLAVTTIITILIKRWFAAHDVKEKKRQDDHDKLVALQKAEEQRLMEEMMNQRCNIQVQAIRTEIQPVVTGLSELRESVCSSLRDDLLNSYWRCHDWQKFRTGWDTENMEDLYKSYKKLGGNSFIDHLMEEFYKIPLQ